MKSNHLIVFVFTAVLLATACTQTENTTKQNTIVVDSVPMAIPLSQQLTALNDSANIRWERMMAADSQKFADIKRLLEEISYCKKYDEKAVDKLLKQRNEVFALRYTQANLSDSLIDLYDSKTTELINKVRNVKANTKEISQHPLADQLENEILKADRDDLLVYRKNYDQAASEYNSFLDQNKEAISADASLANYQKRKTFSVVL